MSLKTKNYNQYRQRADTINQIYSNLIFYCKIVPLPVPGLLPV